MSSSSYRAAIEQITAAEVGQLTQALVAIPTHLPHGTATAVRWLHEVVSTERLPATIQSTGKGPHDNLLIGYPALTPTPKLLLNGHLDTVPPPPHAGRPVVEGNLLFGRGAADMKGGLAAMIMAVVALRRSGVSLKRPVVLAAVAGEETGGIGTAALLRELRPETCLIGEPTRLRLVTAHKGVQWIQITVEGRAAHASCPVEGQNSIVAAAAIVQTLDRLAHKLGQTRTHPLLGPPTLNIGVIRGGVTPNVVPSLCTIQVDRRWLPSESPELILEELRNAVESTVAGVADLKVRIEVLPETVHCRPMETRPDHPFVRQLRQAAAEEGLPVELNGVPYGTDGSLLAAQGIPTVILGPGDIRQAHTDHEHIDLGEVWKATSLYIRILLHVCGGDTSP